MNFLADQDVYAGTVRFLSGLGHDVSTAGQLGLAQANDVATCCVSRTNKAASS